MEQQYSKGGGGPANLINITRSQGGKMGKFAVRKNLCSTENCKLSKIFAIIISLAIVFGVLDFLAFNNVVGSKSKDGSRIINQGHDWQGDPILN